MVFHKGQRILARHDRMGCGRVTMVQYWSYVAMPMFFVVVGFGIVALFTASDIQLLDSASFSIIPALMSSNNQVDNAVLGSDKAIVAAEARRAADAAAAVASATGKTT